MSGSTARGRETLRTIAGVTGLMVTMLVLPAVLTGLTTWVLMATHVGCSVDTSDEGQGQLYCDNMRYVGASMAGWLFYTLLVAALLVVLLARHNRRR